MVFTKTICTVLTFAALSARNSCVKAFAVLFSALTLFTVAPFSLMPRMLKLVADIFLSLLYLMLMSLVIATAITIAVLCA